MRVRPATPADAPALGELVVASWLAAHRGQVPEQAWLDRQATWTPEVSADGWRRLLATQVAGEDDVHVLLVAEEDGALLGQALVRADEDGTAWLLSLYVAPDRLRRGTGRALLLEAARAVFARGCTRLRLGVLSANTPARAFYRALGGLEVGTRTFDEEGHALPETVLAWDDLASLVAP